jgi:tryptophanyl-tRNA synthetase
MSKSDADPKSRILISDSFEEIQKKVKAAVTDSIQGISYDPTARPGVSNLIEIMYHMDESVADSCESLADALKDLSMRALKEKVAETIELHLRPVRERFEDAVHGNAEYLEDVKEEGAQKARASADATLKLVREAVGLN